MQSTKNIFLTGSNAKLLSREIASSLRGRSLSFEILPLSFVEFLAFKDIPIKDTLFEDRGKHLENIVFRHQQQQTEEIYFARTGWKCDFAVFCAGRPPGLVQVTQHLGNDNIARELKGLMAGRQFIGNAECLMLVESAERNLDIPKWIHLQTVQQWLIE